MDQTQYHVPFQVVPMSNLSCVPALNAVQTQTNKHETGTTYTYITIKTEQTSYITQHLFNFFAQASVLRARVTCAKDIATSHVYMGVAFRWR